MTPADAVRVLVVDDNRAIHEDFRKILLGPELDENLQALDAMLFGVATGTDPHRAFLLDSAYQGADALELVQRARAQGMPYSVAFIDMRMPPGWDGLTTIERIWQVDPEIQVVICSAYSDQDWQEVTSRLGNSDRLLILKKPFEPIEVLQIAHALSAKWRNERHVRAHIGSLERDVSERTEGLEAATRQLRQYATHDVLTGLPNRVLLDDRVNQAIAQAERTGEGFALCVLDLDRFKLVNDSFGTHAGDGLLKLLAHRLIGALRRVDTVARLGGDEFVLVIRQAGTREPVERLVRKVLETLNAPAKLGETEVHTSASIGIALYPRDGTSLATLYAHADAAMYCAKQRGGASLEWFVPSMNLATEERVRFEADLHRALKLQQFELYYQPKYDGWSPQIQSAEALIRWHHPERGMVAPDQFIPLAEQSGLIVPIGEWVLRQACMQQRAWQDRGFPALRMAVNISAVQFRRQDLVDTVARALRDAGLEAQFLEIELTETAVMSDPQESVEILRQLSRMGIAVSVDDFGTGYSSMSYLRRFPIDKLKIDRSFITNVLTSADDASIVQAIISLAHGLRLKVVAEGIETAEQLQFLRSLSCDQFQGYFFSRPVEAAGFEHLLVDNMGRTHSRLALLPGASVE
jgi:diguanylate cyclase (GGDEF)-like protein